MLNQRQLEIVAGSLLGDGTIWTNFKDPLKKLQIIQSKCDHVGIDKNSYICWLVSEFLDYGCSVRPRTTKTSGMMKDLVGDKTYYGYVFYTRCHKMWDEIESKWYVPRTDHHRFKRQKIVPRDIKLTPLSLCVWYMDDGCNNQQDANIELNTHCFTKEEIDFLCIRLNEDLNIDSHPKKDREHYKIFVGKKSYFDFLELVKSHVKWDCFKYKIDSSGYNKVPNKGETSPNAKLTNDDVKKIFELKQQGMLQKDVAKRFNVSKTTISHILNGKKYV